MNNKLNNPPQGSTTDAPVGIPPAVASKMPAANESAAEDAGEESDKFSSTNAVFVECAAGKFCKAHHSMANLATCQSAHNCFNCAKKIHSALLCGKKWAAVSHLISGNYLSVLGQEKATDCDEDNITICYLCLHGVAERTQDTTLLGMLPWNEGVPVIPPMTSDRSESPSESVPFDSTLQMDNEDDASNKKRKAAKMPNEEKKEAAKMTAEEKK